MKKINILFAMLLFAASQGAFAQAEQDTLKIEQKEIAAELKELRRQAGKLKLQQSELQRVEHVITSYQSSNSLMALEDVKLIMKTLPTPPEYITDVWRNGLDLSRQVGELRLRQSELQRQENELLLLLLALQRRETEIKRQLEASAKAR